MHRGLVTRREQAGGFDDHLHAEFAPRQFGGIALRQDLERLAVEENNTAFGLDLMAQRAVDGIEFEQMRESGRVGDVVDGYDLEFLFGQGRAQEHSADPAESVYPDFYRHRSILPRVRCVSVKP